MTVKVSSSLYKEMKQLEESGKVDMQDVKAVLEYAKKHGLSMVMRTLQGNPRRYLQCINEGMEASD
jgi:hypothetical protein